MHLICPHCHHPIELVDKTALGDDLLCPSCGSSFHLERGSTTGAAGATPRRLGKFELLHLVGTGAFGSVFKARDPELDRTVAIKLPRAGNLADGQHLDRFLREARSAAQLRHPSIVTIHEVGQDNGLPYLVSDFVDGVTLADLLTSRRPTPHEAARLLLTVAEALEYAHAQGVVHRDVKPSNILLRNEAGNGALHPVLTDFGLAKRDAGEITMTLEGQVLGTPAYMSPEQARGEGHQVDGRSDVYSLGAILYELLTGERPFRGNTRMLLHQVLRDEPRPPRSLNDRIPRDLETICLKCLRKEPGRRYGTARELAADLRYFLKGEPIQARPVGRLERSWRWCRRNPVVAGLLGLVAVLLLGGAVVGTYYAVEAEARQEAIRQRDRADRKAFEAEAAKAEAETNLQEARTQKRRAEHEHQRAEGLVYVQQIALAQREWEAGNVTRAYQMLAACRQDFRGWEYDYLSTLFHSNQRTFWGHTDQVRGVSWSPDGKRLASAGLDNTVKVWDATTGQETLSLQGHTASVWSVSWSPDGKRLASASGDQTLKVWDAVTGQETLSLKGHVNQVHDVSWSPDGKRLASAGLDNTVKVWDAATGQETLSLKGHTWAVYCVAWSPDGKRLASASFDATVKVWDATKGQ